MNIARLRLEEERLRLRHPLAFPSHRSRGRRLAEPDDVIRTCFERDGHRVVHSKAFRRLRNKTQVFFSPENDHIATRMDHSLYVATTSRTICRAVGLNDDLAYAIALGHDLGHAPFGHSGEKVLAELLQRYGRAESTAHPYTHEEQSLRVADVLTVPSGHPYRGLNLTYEVRDGIRCHCGESTERSIRPRPAERDADPSTFVARDTLPITLEGCVVRMADRIAYLGRDYEDAQTALRDVLPPLPTRVATTLGSDNRQIIHTLVSDVIRENRREPEAVGFSEPVFEAMMELRAFNYRNIYLHDRLEDYREKIDAILVRVFEVLMEYLTTRPSPLWATVDPGSPPHIESLARFVAGAGYEDGPDPARTAVDYLSLMTDGYAFKVFQAIVLPEAVV